MKHSLVTIQVFVNRIDFMDFVHDTSSRYKLMQELLSGFKKIDANQWTEKKKVSYKLYTELFKNFRTATYLPKVVKKNIRSLNKIAGEFGIELVQDKDYLYWYGLNDETATRLSMLKSTGIYVAKFSHLSFEQWLEELESIKKQMAAADVSNPNYKFIKSDY